MSNTTPRTYGCHNRAPFSDMQTIGTKQHVGAFDSLVTRPVQIPNFSAGKPCEYTKSVLGQTDTGCTGCKWRQQP